MNFPPKKLGCCLACERECFEVLGTHEAGPLAGHPNRLGPMLPHGLQIGFLLSDGSEADVTFCRDCADQLQPEDYQVAWEACLVRGIQSFEISGRPRAEMVQAMLPVVQKWPIAVRYWRREAPEINRLVLARKPPPVLIADV